MNTLEARRRLLGRNVYKRTTEGNPAIAQGSLARRYPGITMQGWTEQNGTPSPDNPVPIVSAGSGGEIGVTVQGGNLVNIPDIPAGDGGSNIEIPADISAPFVVSVDDSDVVIEGNGVWRLKFDFEDASSLYAVDKNFPKTINANPENKVVAITYRDIRVASGTYRNFMINYGSTPLPYEPYRTPQTVTLTSDRPLTKWDRLIKKDGVWGWEYGSDEYIAPKTGYRMFNRLESATGVYFLYTISDDIGIEISKVVQNQFCNYFKLENPYAFKGNAFWIVKNNEIDKPTLQIGLSDENIDTVEEFEQFLSALDDIKKKKKKANTEFIPLSSEEQEAMNSLYTLRPTTVLSNDCDCNMTLTYKTKKSLEVAT